jgi:hypothetical protein
MSPGRRKRQSETLISDGMAQLDPRLDRDVVLGGLGCRFAVRRSNTTSTTDQAANNSVPCTVLLAAGRASTSTMWINNISSNFLSTKWSPFAASALRHISIKKVGRTRRRERQTLPPENSSRSHRNGSHLPIPRRSCLFYSGEKFYLAKV